MNPQGEVEGLADVLAGLVDHVRVVLADPRRFLVPLEAGDVLVVVVVGPAGESVLDGGGDAVVVGASTGAGSLVAHVAPRLFPFVLGRHARKCIRLGGCQTSKPSPIRVE